MFTNGEKYRVLNSPDRLKVYDAADAEVATSAAIVDADSLFVEGVGTFPIANITDMKLRRAQDAVKEDKEFTCVAPVGLAIGDSILVTVELDTTRYQAEVLSANRIAGGTSISFATAPLTAVAATDIRTAITAAWAAHSATFAIGESSISVTDGTAAADTRISCDAAGSISIKSVKLTRSVGGVALQLPVTLALNVTNGVAFEGDGIGKFLMDSVHLPMWDNTNPYGVDTSDSLIDPRAKYTSISFVVSSFEDQVLGHVAPDYGMTGEGVAKSTRFTLWFNEATSIAADSAIDKLAAIGVIKAGLIAGMTLNVVAAPTTAQELTETLILADGSSTNTSALFIA